MKENRHNIKFASAREFMRCCLLEERKQLIELLQLKVADSEPQITVVTQGGVGKVSALNDRGLYVWIDAICVQKTYRLALFFNEVDESSGNFHSQIGRIQFWKNVQKSGRSGKTPNAKDNESNWILKTANQDKQLVEHPIYIWAEGYDPNQVIASFINFIQKDIEEKVR